MRLKSTNLTLLLVFFILLSPVGAQAQETTTVRGTVRDQAGNPLSGVTINVKGTKTNTLTNDQGAYSIITSNKKSVLIFSFVGLASQELTVGNQAVINISLVPETKEMEGVIVTALNIKRNPK